MSIATEGIPNPRFEFGDRIRKVRRDIAHMTQEQMAAALGVTQKAYAAWESGGKPGDIVAISRRVEELWPGRVTAAWVIGVDENPPPQPPPPPAAIPFTEPRSGGTRAPRRRTGAGRRRANQDDRLVLVQDGTVEDDAVRYVALSEAPSKPVG